jgi:hypothetical protein
MKCKECLNETDFTFQFDNAYVKTKKRDGKYETKSDVVFYCTRCGWNIPLDADVKFEINERSDK